MTAGPIPEQPTTNGEKVDPTELNGRAKVLAVSKTRQAAPQVFAVAVKNILLVNYGCTLGFATILIPELKRIDAEILVTKEQLTWIGSLNLILVPVGCLLSGPLSHYLGRRKTMMLANLPFILAWILYYYSTTPTMLFGSLVLTGLTGGLLEAPVLTYVAEITQPHLRGMLSATSTMSVTLGTFLQMLAGSLTTWRYVALINITLPVLCLLGLWVVPESPHWLIGKKRYEEASKSLAWLRGWVTPVHTSDEFDTLRHSIENPVRPPSSNGEEEKKWRVYAKKRFYMPFSLVALSFFIGSFGGMQSLQTYAVTIFEAMHAPISQYTATVFLGLAQFIGTICCAVSIHFTGKRRLTFVSIVATALCFSVSSVYAFLSQGGEDNVKNHTWIPTTFLIGSAFFSHIGIRLLPWILIGEVFPAQVRSEASGAASSFSYLCNFLVNKVFLYMVDDLTLAGTFCFYAAIGFVGFVVLYFFLPETEGRTLREIEDHYAGIQSLKQRPTKAQSLAKEKWATVNPAIVLDDVESKL